MDAKMKAKNKLAGIAAVTAMLLTLVSCSEVQKSASCSVAAGPVAPQGAVIPNPFPAGFGEPNEGTFTEQKMLVNIGVNVILKDVRNFRLKSEILKEALVSACQAKMTPVAETEVKSAFKEAMLAFHAVEAASFGPMAEDKAALHSRIYSWPFINPCGIDQETEALTRSAAKKVSDLGINIKGLGAIEYLLFEPTLISKCNARAFPQMKTWNDNAATDKKIHRCQMAKRLATDLATVAASVEERWNIDQGNYSKTLIDGSRFCDMNEGVTEVVHGLFAFERLKDERLGRPLGLHKLCTADDKKCVDHAEHSFSGLALSAIRMQFESFKEVYFGSQDPDAKAFGIDDLLIVRGHPAAVVEIRNAMDRLGESLREVEALGSLQEQIVSMDADACRLTTVDDRRVPVCAMYQDLRRVTNLFKTDVLTMLSVRAPPGYQGDND